MMNSRPRIKPAWADFIAEFGLDLVQVGSAAVGSRSARYGQVGDHFSWVGPAEVAAMTVLETQQSWYVLFQRPDSRHSSAGCAGINIKSASGVHFFANMV
jgi:hypothetical protein